MGVTVAFSLSQFSEVFKIRDATGLPYILIGGQAVNYWAERYLAIEPQLKSLQPFTSEDIDFKGGSDDVRRILGVSQSVDALAVQAEWNGKTIRVLDPISLLASKLELIARVPQEKRRDVAHLKILLPCVRAFLHEFLQQVESGQIPAKHWLGAVNQVLKLTTNQRARKIAGRHQINWPEILPLSAIASSKHEKIRRFQEQQLERGFKKQV